MNFLIATSMVLLLINYAKSYIINTRSRYGNFLIVKAHKSDKEDKKKYTKSNLPSKLCVVCGRPFNWRKKWEKVWDEVKYCSDRCRGNRNSASEDNRSNKSSMTSIFNSNSYLPKNAYSERKKTINKSFLSILAIGLMKSIAPASAKDKYIRPTKDELTHDVTHLFKEYDWTEEEFKPYDFKRLDESNDDNFYVFPRFVEHIDELAVKSLTNFHDKVLSNYYGKVDVLDLCSSWVSHISTTTAVSNLVGIGMNIEELKRNPKLTSYYTQDLNKNYELNFPDNSFDIVLLQLSIDYLIHPIELLKEVNRILRSEGALYISFSNRVFIEKAVSVWTGKSDLEHIEIVGKYLHYAGGYKEPVNIYDLTPKKSNYDGDPLYVVQGIKI